MMPGGIFNKGNFYREVVPANFTVVGGAAGFVDTDVSATCPGARWAWFRVFTAANQNAGCRRPFSAVDTKVPINAGVNSIVGFCQVVNGHCDLYRDAADNNYLLMGYWV